MELQVIDDGVWGLEVAQPLPGGFALPVRMVVVRPPSGGLWVHNPVALDDAETPTGALLWCTQTRKELAQSISCHGEVLDGPDTRARLEAVLAWMLRGA